MIDDEKIIELFFERSEQGIRELDMKYGKNLSQPFVQHCEQQTGRGGMCKRRLFRRMERYSPGTPKSLVVLHCENRAEHFPQNLLEKGSSKTKRTLYGCLRGNRGLHRRPENRGR